MLIWSVIPNHIIWETQKKEETEQMKVMKIKGTQVMVEPVGNGKGRIRQVLSTNPTDFLKEDLSPGSIVQLN